MQISQDERFLVVVNDELQYAIWPAHTALPSGWRDAAFAGTRAACLDEIRRVWTDLRPRSVREHVGAAR